MRIKKQVASLLMCVFLILGLPAVCFAAETDGQDSVETVEVEAAGEDEKGNLPEAGSEAETGAEMGPERTETVPERTEAVPKRTETVPERTGTAQETDVATDQVTTEDDGGFTVPYSIEEWKQLFSDSDTEDGTTAAGRVNVSRESYLNLRAGSGLDKDIIGHLLTGDELEIVGEDGDWYQVAVKEHTGYVWKDYVDVTDQEISEGMADEDMADEDMMALLFYLMLAGQTETGSTPDSSAALTPDGNLTLVDDYSEEHGDGSGKQFITVTTKDGNYFYLVIDRDEDGDENVHFMNLVDEADLLALMEEDEAAKYTAPAEPEEPAETEPAEPEDGEGEQKEEPEKKPGMNLVPVLILVIALIGGGGFFVFTKLKGKKKKQEQEKPDPDADYVDGEDEADFDLPDDADVVDDGEDDSTMFDAEDNEPV